MPQNSLGSAIARNSTGAYVPLSVDLNGNLRVANAEDSSDNTPVLNITAATVITAAPGTITQLYVVVAGSAPGTVNDCATVGAVAVANRIAILPNVVGPVIASWPFNAGLVVTPGTGQTISVAYSAG